jgi:hypothetical protein
VGEKIKLPLIWLGMNPLFIFVGMIFWEALLMWNIKFEYLEYKLIGIIVLMNKIPHSGSG